MTWHWLTSALMKVVFVASTESRIVSLAVTVLRFELLISHQNVIVEF
jgi:hypothetical protein